MRAIIILFLTGLIAACGDPSAEQEDTRMRFTRTLNSRIDLPEEQLVRSMGRGPDSNYQLNANTRLLRWRMEVPYRIPGRSPEYVAIGTAIVPVGGQPATRAMAYCNVEWRIVGGVANSFQTYGDGCP